MDDTQRESFLAGARIAADLAGSPEETAQWADESACAGMSVG